MAFTTVDISIQEMLQTDFIVDLAQIHNTNVLLLKDKIEDIMNTFEIDVNTISIGVDNPINTLKVQDIVIQDGGWLLQTGIPNQIIAKLEINGSNQSVLNVDVLNVDINVSADAVTVNDLTINDSVQIDGQAAFANNISYTGQLAESKETVSVTVEFDGVDTASGRLTMTDTSRTNIYVKLAAETAVGATQVWDGASLAAGLANIILYIDFDTNNPPAQNTSFKIYLVDVVENSGSTSLATELNTANIDISIAAGLNLSTGSSQILLHNDLDSLGFKLGINSASSDLLSSGLSKYGSNATFNYIVDEDGDDRILITSAFGMEIYS